MVRQPQRLGVGDRVATGEPGDPIQVALPQQKALYGWQVVIPHPSTPQSGLRLVLVAPADNQVIQRVRHEQPARAGRAEAEGVTLRGKERLALSPRVDSIATTEEQMEVAVLAHKTQAMMACRR